MTSNNPGKGWIAVEPGIGQIAMDSRDLKEIEFSPRSSGVTITYNFKKQVGSEGAHVLISWYNSNEEMVPVDYVLIHNED